MWQLACGLLIGFICFKFWETVQPFIVNSLEWLASVINSI